MPAILVIDDDLGTRETYKWALQAHGFNVTTAGSGARALALQKSGHFDLMLLDLRLPDISGIDVVRSMQSEGAAMPFVLVSAFLTPPVTTEAKALGAIGVWEKPMTMDAVVGHVREALAKS